MAKSKNEQLYELLKPEVEALGYRCVDVEFEKKGKDWVLTVYIGHPDGISLDDCEKVSHRLSDVLDETDPIEQSYLLEVSSPGIDRPFSRAEDYEAALDTMVDITFYQQIDGQKKISGILKSFDDESVVIETDDHNELVLLLKNIAKTAAHIVF